MVQCHWHRLSHEPAQQPWRHLPDAAAAACFFAIFSCMALASLHQQAISHWPLYQRWSSNHSADTAVAELEGCCPQKAHLSLRCSAVKPSFSLAGTPLPSVRLAARALSVSR